VHGLHYICHSQLSCVKNYANHLHPQIHQVVLMTWGTMVAAVYVKAEVQYYKGKEDLEELLVDRY
jgi:hypothetical protein